MNNSLYPNARKYLSDRFWAILPSALDTICEVLQLRASGLTFTQEEINARISGGPGMRSQQAQSGAIAILPLYGVIDQKIGSMMQISGGTSVDGFMQSFRTALNDDSVKAILIDVDSPGGSVAGIQEAAEEIFKSRSVKPIYALANTQIASAAYWIACAAQEIVCMPSGFVGSIGVLYVRNDQTEANKMEGLKPTFITSAEYKVEMNPNIPFTEDGQAYLQGQVNKLGDTFNRTVAKYRKVPVETVRAQFGKGRMLLPEDALAVGMIDSIGTFDQTITRILKETANARAMSASAEHIQASLPQDEKTCDCECGDNCDCGGANDTCCGNSGCKCCSADDADAKAIAAKQFSLGEISRQSLVGLADAVTRWEALVERTPTLTKAKAETILELQSGVRDALAKIDAIAVRASTKESEPVADTSEDLNLLALEKERFRLLAITR